MDAVVRAVVIYGFLVLLFRLAGKRTLQQVTTFDIVLLLIISEATQQALLGDDHSITAAVLVITTLVGLELLFDLLGHRLRVFDHVIDSRPEVIVDEGRPLHDRLKRHRMDEDDVLEAARAQHGIVSMAGVRYAVLERSGSISVIPADGA